ncbi:MAG: Tetratricopeptide repeat protein [candidate division BRC1 bacterium ADurb.BinA364]|nr:MAG: Tetratricopeptide repeat protein [candidate division BRC1 bacterium ADurb.BinA364]
MRALRSDPANAESVYYAGHVRYALGDLAGAILHFEHYLSLKPGDSATRENLALLHEQSGRPAEARRLRSGAPQ